LPNAFESFIIWPGERTMENGEIEITDVVIVLDELDDQQTITVVEQLKTVGLSVESVDNDASVVEGCVETARLHELHKVVHVRYVRSVFTYEARKPAKGTTNPGDDEDRYDN
jgi:hypothetical protein